MQYPRLSHSFEVEDVCGIVRLNYARRVVFYNGDAELAPGITIHAASGHSAGLQFVRVKTRRGPVVLVHHGSLGQIEVVNQAVKLSRTPSQIAHPTPEKGEHTEEVLKEYGYDDQSIAEFRARKIV